MKPLLNKEKEAEKWPVMGLTLCNICMTVLKCALGAPVYFPFLTNSISLKCVVYDFCFGDVNFQVLIEFRKFPKSVNRQVFNRDYKNVFKHKQATHPKR